MIVVFGLPTDVIVGSWSIQLSLPMVKVLSVQASRYSVLHFESSLPVKRMHEWTRRKTVFGGVDGRWISEHLTAQLRVVCSVVYLTYEQLHHL